MRLIIRVAWLRSRKCVCCVLVLLRNHSCAWGGKATRWLGSRGQLAGRHALNGSLALHTYVQIHQFLWDFSEPAQRFIIATVMILFFLVKAFVAFELLDMAIPVTLPT